jgi:hypothetical protein
VTLICEEAFLEAIQVAVGKFFFLYINPYPPNPKPLPSYFLPPDPYPLISFLEAIQVAVGKFFFLYICIDI